MMWTTLFFCVLVGLTSAEHAWKPGSQYLYQVQGRTLAGLHQVSNEFSGVFIKARLTVNVDSDELLTLKIRDAKYANVQHSFSGGWDSEIPEDQVYYKNFQVQDKPFQLHLKNGTIDKMAVDRNVDVRELNFLKAVASQLQVDTQGENLKNSKSNNLPKDNEGFGVYKTMEDSVNGVYETIYDLSPLPEYIAIQRPELVPIPQLRGHGQFIEIQKTRNFSSSEQHVIYRFGANGHEGLKAGSNQMGNFLSRSSVSRIIISGDLKQYTIQSSVTVEKVLIAPHLYNGQKGLVVSSLNLTLVALTSTHGSSDSLDDPKIVKNLVYEPVKSGENGWEPDSGEDSSSSSDSSDSSSDSSSSSSDTGDSSSDSSASHSGESSSSSDSSEGEPDEEVISKRFRRAAQMILDKKTSKNSPLSGKLSENSASSDSSSSSSSSEEFIPSSPGLNEAPFIEFMPDYMGGFGSEEVDYVAKIIELAQEVGFWVKKADRVQDESILERYSLLTSLVASASSDQLKQAGEKLKYIKIEPRYENKEDSQKYQAWVAYRDAVAQAGTGPALVAIQEWIENGQIRGEEAAQVVAALAYAARYPTTEYMNTLFELTKSRHVQKQKHLNTSSVIAFTELVSKSQVDKEGSRNRYPTNLFKNKEHGQVVGEKYMPWLQEQLRNAVSEGDSHKIQVYIRAIGNTGHPNILAAFEPYLEGKEQVSNFQRLSMVAALDKLAWLHPNIARRVLFRVYENLGESPEVRVAAVYLIMKANPSAQVLQRMAQSTHFEHSDQVCAAVKYSIEKAAQKETEARSPQLYNNARAAANMLTPKDYGMQYSKNFIQSYISRESAQFLLENAHIHGKDSIISQGFNFKLHSRVGGIDLRPEAMSYLSSSVEDLLRLLARQLADIPSRGMNAHQVMARRRLDYTYNNIVSWLKLETDQQEQVEGSAYISLLGANRFFTYDNHTIEQLPSLIEEWNRRLQKGENVQKTKLYNKNTLELGFPVAMGVPFYYSLQEPAMISVRGQFKGYTERQPQGSSLTLKAGINGDVELSYASQLRGRMGFLYPFNNNRYVAGLNKNLQVYVPLKGKVELNGQENNLQAILEPYSQSRQNIRLLQSSTNAYHSYLEASNIKPSVENKNTKAINAPAPHQYQNTVGRDETGYAFDVEIRTSQNWRNSFAKYFSQAVKEGPLSAIFYNRYPESIANDYMSVTYNPQKSSQKPAKFSLSLLADDGSEKPSEMLMKLREFKNGMDQSGGESDNLAQPSSYANRQQELYANVQKDIQDARVIVVDAAVTFQGDSSDAGYSMTVAHADSPVAEQSRALLYLHAKPYQSSQKNQPLESAMEFNIKSPQVPIFQYKEAINAKPDSEVNGKFNFRNGSSEARLTYQGSLRRSQGRKNFVQQHPTSELCENQMEQGNYIQSACRNATVSALFADRYDLSVKYENIPRRLRELAHDIYNLARYAGFENYRELADDRQRPEGEILIAVQFAHNLENVNIGWQSPTQNAGFMNLTVPDWAVPIVVHHPARNQLLSRDGLFTQEMTYMQPQVSAVIDGNRVTTFDNKSYPIDLGNCYHVFAMYAPHEYDNNDDDNDINDDDEQDFAVLVKENDSNNKEVQVVLGYDYVKLSGSGSSGFSVQANKQKLQLSEHQVSRWSNNRNKNHLLAYALPQNVAVLYLPRNQLQIIYDGNRMKLTIGNRYRNRVRGLAGTFNADDIDDFTLPNNRLFREPLEYAATYALTRDSACQGPARQRQKDAQTMLHYEKNIQFVDLISESDWNLKVKNNLTESKNKSKKEMGKQCMNLQVNILETNGKTCFSIKPQPECNSHCRPSNLTMRNVEFHCVQSSNAATHWVKMIKKGAQPNFAHKTVNHKQSISLPESCVSRQ